MFHCILIKITSQLWLSKKLPGKLEEVEGKVLFLQPKFGASSYSGSVSACNQDNCGLWRSWGSSLYIERIEITGRRRRMKREATSSCWVTCSCSRYRQSPANKGQIASTDLCVTGDGNYMESNCSDCDFFKNYFNTFEKVVFVFKCIVISASTPTIPQCLQHPSGAAGRKINIHQAPNMS